LKDCVFAVCAYHVLVLNCKAHRLDHEEFGGGERRVS
jgi:hypothetical protein